MEAFSESRGGKVGPVDYPPPLKKRYPGRELQNRDHQVPSSKLGKTAPVGDLQPLELLFLRDCERINNGANNITCESLHGCRVHGFAQGGD